MKIYNTEKRAIVEFQPMAEVVGIYNCGPTVYDYAHIGNLRAFLFADLLRRTLELAGYKVKQVMNITDVGHLVSDADTGEDKIEKGAKRENKSAYDIARYYEQQFLEDLKELNIKTPEVMPRATEHIEEQIELIKELERKGFTYKIGDGIYFNTSKYPQYGKMARLDIEGLREGARVEVNLEKKNVSDFALWKFSPKDAKRDMEWNSPWGKGFPGWHIECSAMSVKYLGQPFDIHTGGVDHIPVHHTNEIAQSEAAYEKPLARYWMHSEFLSVDGQKMSKSLGNFYTLRDIKERGFSSLDFRYLCLQSHYRSKMNFTWEALEAAKNARIRLKRICVENFSFDQDIPNKPQIADSKYYKLFTEKLLNDLNMPEALAVLWEMLRDEKENSAEKMSVLEILDQDVLGLNLFENDQIKVPKEVQEMFEQRNLAKAEKDFIKADELRRKIGDLGWEIEDTTAGPRIVKR